MKMRKAAIISALLHLGVIVLLIVGLPFFPAKKSELIVPLSVEVVDIADRAKAPNPKPVPKPEPKEEPKPTPKPEPKVQPQPQSEPVPEKKPEPKPEPLPEVKKEEPKKEEAVVPEKPKKEPVPPKEKPKKVEKPKKPVEKKKDKQKKSEDRFNSILKNLEKMKSSATEEDKKDDKNEETEEDAGAQAGDVGDKVTMTELDALRRQLAGCWNIPAGAMDAENLSIEIKIWINSDATVRDAKIVDTARAASDPFYRAAAESARRAALSPQCSPLKLPTKYKHLKMLTVNFNPKEMLGM
jgi:DNA polymerase III gamma/tau subunit